MSRLLGDMWVQIVDVPDETRVNAYSNFAKECDRRGYVIKK